LPSFGDVVDTLTPEEVFSIAKNPIKLPLLSYEFIIA
jgi:hypothetical protein